MNIQSIRGLERGCLSKALMIVLACSCAMVSAAVFAAPPVAPPTNDKCDALNSFDMQPSDVVDDGTQVDLVQDVTVSSVGSGSQDCGLDVGDHVVSGNLRIQQVNWEGDPRDCDDLEFSYCSAGQSSSTSCNTDTDCDTELGSQDGVCTAVGVSTLIQDPNTSTGHLEWPVDTTGMGYGVYGYVAQYQAAGRFEDDPGSAPDLCRNLTVNAVGEPCEGATITIDQAAGPGEPKVPGGPYDWSFRVTVHACEDLYGVTAQGGTNGWAQLAGRSEEALHPSTADGSAVIRKANRKTDVIFWTIGDMSAGDTETLEVYLTGSIKGAPDCQVRFLSGPWSALFSTDGLTFEKTDYTGRVSIFTNSNGVTGDCSF